MAIITAKVISATTQNGMAIIVLEFDDGLGKWQKTYTQAHETIKAADFKEMVAADIRRDLKIQTQLLELTPLVGKTFTFSV